jgi:hypothetical protein
MASTNRSRTAYVAEVTHGVMPATPAFKEFRVASNLLVLAPTRVIAAEIRSDRQVVDHVLTDLNNNGNIGIELSFGSHDDMIEAALQGSWTNKPSITVATTATEISAVSATTLTVETPLGSPFLAGMLCLTAGFPTPANNGILSVVSSSSATTVVFPSSTFTVETLPIPVGAYVRVVGFEGASGDIAAVTSPGNALTSTVLDFTTLGLNLGEYVRIGGDAVAAPTTVFATAGCNGFARVSAIAAHLLSFDIVPATWAADAGTSKTIQVFTGDYVKNGIIQRSFTIERQQQDLLAPSFEYFLGDQVDALSLTLKANTIISGTLNFMGLSATAGTVRASGATDIAANTNLVLNAASNVGRLAIGGVQVAGPSFIQELAFDLKNNIARETSVGSLYATGLRDGELALGGNLVVYFGDLTMLDYVLNDSVIGLNFRTGRSDGFRQSLLFDIPSAKVTGTSPVNAKNQSRMFTGRYDALRNATLGYTCAAMRFWYLPAGA